MSRLDRHQVTIRVLIAAIQERATDMDDTHLLALVDKLASVQEEHRHLLDGVMEAFEEPE